MYPTQYNQFKLNHLFLASLLAHMLANAVSKVVAASDCLGVCSGKFCEPELLLNELTKKMQPPIFLGLKFCIDVEDEV